MIDRRAFVKSTIAATACASSLVPTLTYADPIPSIVGDGVHDDGPGLNALFAGKPYKDVNNLITATYDHMPMFEFEPGVYRYCETIYPTGHIKGRTGKPATVFFKQGYPFKATS